jgi:hypothetical protein
VNRTKAKINSGSIEDEFNVVELFTRILGTNDSKSGIYSKEIDWQGILMTPGSKKMDFARTDSRTRNLGTLYCCSGAESDICEEVCGNSFVLKLEF